MRYPLPQTAKALANELRERIQALGYARHRLIIQVQGIESHSDAKLQCGSQFSARPWSSAM